MANQETALDRYTQTMWSYRKHLAEEISPLQGVSFIFSDGTTLRIDKGNPEAIVLLIVMYKKEAALCLG